MLCILWIACIIGSFFLHVKSADLQVQDEFSQAVTSKSLRECLRIIGKESEERKKEDFCLRAAKAFLGYPAELDALYKIEDALQEQCGLAHLAIRAKEYQFLEKLLTCSFINVACIEGGTFVHWAARYNAVSALRMLDTYPQYKWDARDKKGRTPFHWAVCTNATDAMKLLRLRKVAIDASDKEKQTAFHMAAAHGAVEALKLLHEWGVSFRQTCSQGREPVHYAALNGQCNALCYLKQIRAFFSVFDAREHSPFDVAMENNKAEALMCLYDLAPDEFPHYSYKGQHKDINDIMVFLSRVRGKFLDIKTFFYYALYRKWHHLVAHFLRTYPLDLNKPDEAGNFLVHGYKHTRKQSESFSYATIPHFIIDPTSLLMLLRNPFVNTDPLTKEKMQRKKKNTLLHDIYPHIHQEMRRKITFILCMRRIHLPNDIIRILLSSITVYTKLDRSLAFTYPVYSQLLYEKKIEQALQYIGFECNDKKRARLCYELARTVLHHPESEQIFVKIQTLLHGCQLGLIAAYYDDCSLLEKLKNFSMSCKYGGRLLHWAAAGDAVKVIAWLKAQKVPWCEDNKGRSPLYWAAENNAIQAIDVLKNWNKSAIDSSEWLKELVLQVSKCVDKETPLHVAAQANAVKALELLYYWGADLNAHDNKGRTVAHYAAMGNARDVLHWLNFHNVDVSEGDNEGKTPWHYACEANALEAMQVLHDAKIDVQKKAKNGMTALHYAAKTNARAAVHILKDLRFSASDRCREDSSLLTQWRTPLYYAAKYNALEVLELFKSWYDERNVRFDHTGNGLISDYTSWVMGFSYRTDYKPGSSEDRYMQSLPHRTIRFEKEPDDPRVEALKIIQENRETARKVDGYVDGIRRFFNVVDVDGELVIHWAAQGDALDVLVWLLDIHKEYVLVRDADEKTALHHAAEHNAARAIWLLLKCGAQKTAIDCKRRTPLDLARAKKALLAIEALAS